VLSGIGVLWPNGRTDQDETCHAGRGSQLPLPQRGTAPQISAHMCCSQTVGRIKMPLGMKVGLDPGDFVLNGDPVPLSPKRRRIPLPKFLAHVYCGQTAGWIKMVLGTEVSVSPGDFVLDGDPALLPKKRAEPSPIFGPFLLWPNGWMHQDATWYGGSEVALSPADFVLDGDEAPQKRGAAIFGPRVLRRNGCRDPDATWYRGMGPRPRRHCVLDGDPAPLPKMGVEPPTLPNFRPMSIDPKRLDRSRWHLT